MGISVSALVTPKVLISSTLTVRDLVSRAVGSRPTFW